MRVYLPLLLCAALPLAAADFIVGYTYIAEPLQGLGRFDAEQGQATFTDEQIGKLRLHLQQQDDAVTLQHDWQVTEAILPGWTWHDRGRQRWPARRIDDCFKDWAAINQKTRIADGSAGRSLTLWIKRAAP